MRLQRYIAMCGVTSRRKAEGLIAEGRVKVNGEVVEEMGIRVDKSRDQIKVDGKLITIEKEDVYILLNKPKGVVTTVSDDHGRPVVLDLIEGVDERIYPVGRLDIDTTGLLLLTNDGKTTNKLTHPSYEIVKSYIALVNGIPSEDKLKKFREGLNIDGVMTYPAKVRIIKTLNNKAKLEIEIHEGRNRQVRNMCSHIGHPVLELKRIKMGEIELGNLGIGKWRELSKSEVGYLKSL